MIGPTPGTPGPTISAAGGIGTIQAEEINAVITAGGTLNFINATTGGVHGLIQVDELVDENPLDNVMVFQTEAVSSARIEVDSVNWLLSFGAGLAGDPEWSGLFVAGDVTADIVAAGPVDMADQVPDGGKVGIELAVEYPLDVQEPLGDRIGDGELVGWEVEQGVHAGRG